MAGFRVAGKTATAQKVDPATGKYSEDRYTASFVGFVPADKPRLVIAVVLDEPMIGRYGGDLAGPVFRRVAEASLRYLGVAPSNAVPKIKAVTRAGDPAEATLAAMNGAKAKTDGTSAPLPAPAAPLGPPPPNSVRVPDALGMCVRSATRLVGSAGLVPLFEGTGRLVKQLTWSGAPAPRPCCRQFPSAAPKRRSPAAASSVPCSAPAPGRSRRSRTRSMPRRSRCAPSCNPCNACA